MDPSPPFASASDATRAPASAEAPSWARAFRRVLRGRVAIPALLVIGALAAGGWWYRVTRPDYRLARGEEAVAERDWRAAEAFAAKLESAGHPDRAHLLRGLAYQARGDPEQALRECNLVREQGPIRRRAALVSGRSLLDLGALSEADRVFAFVLAEDPDSADAHRGQAVVAYELGQMNRAIAHLEHVVRLDPADARPHRMLGEIYRDSDDTLNSVAEFREALRLRAGLSDEATAEVRFEIAEGLVQVRRFDEALAALDEFAGPDGEAPHMRALRVEALTGLGRHPEAAALADRELAAHPDGPFYRLRGQLYLEDGNPEAAIPLLERSVRLSPHHYQSHFLLARAYGAAGRKADAERMKARAEEIQRDYELTATLARQAVARPWDPAVRLQLAELSERVGDAKSAAMWRKAAAQCQARNR